MAVHFWGPLHTMRAAIPHMRNQGGGRIVNISSIAGKIGVPHLAPYCAGKFALTGLSTAVTPELARDNIVVTTVCPGLMRTGSPFNAWFKGHHRQEFAWFAIADSLPLLSANGRRAAAQIVDAMRHGDAELVITWAARLAVLAGAAMPNTVALALQAANSLLPGPAGPEGDRARNGWQSASDWAPSSLIRLTEMAAAENNEVPNRRPRRRRPADGTGGGAHQTAGRCGSCSTCVSPSFGSVPVTQPFTASNSSTGRGLLISRNTAAWTATPISTMRGSSGVP